MTGIFLVLLALTGLCGLLCLVWCRMVLPVSGHGLWTVVRAEGDGEGLEQQVRGLVWLHSCGVLHGSVMVADAGLSEQGLRLARSLAGRWPQVTVCSRIELARQLSE
ncbi:MAG: hypothetical protein IJP02_07710 [Oscillospiraceae bacterium]|nr:hypothetical protein [Oscillospiraceae bacterium]